MPTTCLDASTLVFFVSLTAFIALIVGGTFGFITSSAMRISARESDYLEGWEDRDRQLEDTPSWEK